MSYICKNPWTTLFLWGNGDVTHCCYSNIGRLGNIKDKSIKEMWAGDKINYVRRTIERGEYLKAGCEHFCRSYRWNSFYGAGSGPLEIPEGLGRVEDLGASRGSAGPTVLGVGIDWKCNLKCRHCLSSRKGKGVSRKDFAALEPYLAGGEYLRFMGGEFTINEECLELLRYVASVPGQPTVFLSTNGQAPTEKALKYCEGLKSFHLKFSLEGLGEDYERIRVGGTWAEFEKNLDVAADFFADKRRQRLDWRLYLNYCVMKSNFRQLPAVIAYAVKKNIPLVLNTINGMRHIDENMFMYKAACPPKEALEAVGKQCEAVLASADGYVFGKELLSHLDYILKCAGAKKLNLPSQVLKAWRSVFRGRFADWTLYCAYRVAMDKKSFLIYIVRKLREKARRKLSGWGYNA